MEANPCFAVVPTTQHTCKYVIVRVSGIASRRNGDIVPRIDNIFDIIGPVMVGPSSSHTAGAVRLGALARGIYGSEPDCALIELHGSFRATAQGHGTKLALVAGLLGMGVDDTRIIQAIDLARERRHKYRFAPIELDDAHPNTVMFHLGSGDDTRVIQGSSLGGGAVCITHIDGYEAEVTGMLPTLVIVHQDKPGAVAAVTPILAQHGVNIANMRVSRQQRGQDALMLIEADCAVHKTTLDLLRRLDRISSVTFVPTV